MDSSGAGRRRAPLRDRDDTERRPSGCPSESSAAYEPAATGEYASPADVADAALLEGIDLSGEEAAEEIATENADAEFEKLMQEIEGS